MRLLTMTFPLAGQGKAFIAGDARQGLQPLLRTVPKDSTKTDYVTKPACMPGQTTSSQRHFANDSRSRHIMGDVPFVALHCSHIDTQACCLTPANESGKCTDACTCLSGCLENWSSEHQVAAFAQVVIVHALGDLGDGIIS